MKKCANCGTSLPDGAVFCTICNSTEFKAEVMPDFSGPKKEKPKIEYDQYGRPIGQNYQQPDPPQPTVFPELTNMGYGSGYNDDYSSEFSQQFQQPQYIEQYSGYQQQNQYGGYQQQSQYGGYQQQSQYGGYQQQNQYGGYQQQSQYGGYQQQNSPQQYQSYQQQPVQQEYQPYEQQPVQQEYQPYEQQPVQQEYQPYEQQPVQQEYQAYEQQPAKPQLNKTAYEQKPAPTNDDIEEEPQVPKAKPIENHPSFDPTKFVFEKKEETEEDEEQKKENPTTLKGWIEKFQDTKDYTHNYDQNDFAAHRKHCILAALGITFWVPYAFCSNSLSSRFYANQGLLTLIVEIIFGSIYALFANIISIAFVENTFDGYRLSIAGWIVGIIVTALCFAIPVFIIYTNIKNIKAGKVKDIPFIGQIRLIR